ncbi:MAG: hypothetical protein FWC80_04850 [Firmicutes bacterium]|nr:hypothetical protein [Bacillota bacterium]
MEKITNKNSKPYKSIFISGLVFVIIFAIVFFVIFVNVLEYQAAQREIYPFTLSVLDRLVNTAYFNAFILGLTFLAVIIFFVIVIVSRSIKNKSKNRSLILFVASFIILALTITYLISSILLLLNFNNYLNIGNFRNDIVENALRIGNIVNILLASIHILFCIYYVVYIWRNKNVL